MENRTNAANETMDHFAAMIDKVVADYMLTVKTDAAAINAAYHSVDFYADEVCRSDGAAYDSRCYDDARSFMFAALSALRCEGRTLTVFAAENLSAAMNDYTRAVNASAAAELKSKTANAAYDNQIGYVSEGKKFGGVYEMDYLDRHFPKEDRNSAAQDDFHFNLFHAREAAFDEVITAHTREAFYASRLYFDMTRAAVDNARKGMEVVDAPCYVSDKCAQAWKAFNHAFNVAEAENNSARDAYERICDACSTQLKEAAEAAAGIAAAKLKIAEKNLSAARGCYDVAKKNYDEAKDAADSVLAAYERISDESTRASLDVALSRSKYNLRAAENRLEDNKKDVASAERAVQGRRRGVEDARKILAEHVLCDAKEEEGWFTANAAE